MDSLGIIKRNSHYINNELQQENIDFDKLGYRIKRSVKQTIKAMQSSIRLSMDQPKVSKKMPGLSAGGMSFTGNPNNSSSKDKRVFNIATSCVLDTHDIISDLSRASLIHNTHDLLNRYETVYFLAKDQLHSFIYHDPKRNVTKARKVLTKEYDPNNQEKMILVVTQMNPKDNYKVRQLVCYVSKKLDKEFWK